jgi:hypothetical protein
MRNKRTGKEDDRHTVQRTDRQTDGTTADEWMADRMVDYREELDPVVRVDEPTDPTATWLSS